MGEPAVTAPAAGAGEAREVRVHLYGCLRPTRNEENVRAQMLAAHRYQNQLIALERCRRAVYRSLRSELCDLGPFEQAVDARVKELAALRSEINAQRSAARSRLALRAESARAREVYEELRKARALLKEAQRAARENPAFQAAARELDERARTWQRGLRAHCGCFWGTYLAIERAMDQARRSTVDPEFKRWRGEGRISVQLQGGLTVEALHRGRDTRARLIPAPARWLGKAKSARGTRHKVRHLLQVRIGSTGASKREPVWAEFPIIMHRPLPDDALLRGIVVRLRKVGLSERWSASFTYAREPVPLPQHGGVVAIDLGWRKRPDNSLRVAYWVDDQGRSGEVRMPARVRARLAYADGLREIQDRRFAKTMTGLRRWLHAAQKRFVLPPFLRDALPYLDQWRSHRRLHALVDAWRSHRFDGDKQIFAALCRWQVKSNHLYTWECHQRSRVLGYRREVYRMAAARFARHYGVAIFEDFDIAKAKRLSLPEQEGNAPRAQRGQLHVSAPGEFRLAVVQAVEREGGVAVKLRNNGTTSTCHQCGCVCKWDQKEDIWHTCEHCGSMWDQDFNAAKNLLAHWQGKPVVVPKKIVRLPKIRKRKPDEDASKA